MIAAALALLFAAAPAEPRAPMPGASLVREGLSSALSEVKAGEWVTYRFDGGGGRVHFWRIAVVGEQRDAKGRPAVWLELEFGDHHAMKAPLAQMRLLAARETGLKQGGVTRAFVAFGAGEPREVEPQSLELVDPDADAKVIAPKQEESGPVDPKLTSTRTGQSTRLITLAGTVTATPHEVAVRQTVLKRIWVSAQVPILHVAKVEMPPIAHTMEVRDFGVAAKALMAPPPPGAAKVTLDR